MHMQIGAVLLVTVCTWDVFSLSCKVCASLPDCLQTQGLQAIHGVLGHCAFTVDHSPDADYCECHPNEA
jgi:hypothetical protein